MPHSWLVFSSQGMSAMLNGPGDGICNFFHKFLSVTSHTLNISCTMDFKLVLLSFWAAILAQTSKLEIGASPFRKSSGASYETKS
jgi:hypothetical protein